jgi:hypothetical protein
MVMLGAVSQHSLEWHKLATNHLDFSHDHARSRTFRWGEDGIAGVSDTHGIQNIAFSFWNKKEYVGREKHPPEHARGTNQHDSEFLKERLFGLSNPQGNHGESVKEAHFHVDNTPTVGSSRVN